MQQEPPVFDFEGAEIDVAALMVYAVPLLVISAILYIYLSVSLMIMARKTNTPHAWLAWVPLFNVVLMCQIGGVSLAWILAFMIPCLNIVAVVVVWSAMATARGKSSVAGLLVLLPGINLFVPAWLAMGPPSPLVSGAVISPASRRRQCPKCSAAASTEDAFCGECGAQLPQPTAAATTSAAPAAKSSGCGIVAVGVLGLFALCLLGCCGVGGFFFFYDSPYQPPERDTPAMPQRLAGTLTQFPIDSADADQPAHPKSLLSQDFRGKGFDQEVDTVQVAAEQLPPGIEPRQIPSVASGISSAVYRTAPESPPINVHVLESNSAGETSAAMTERVLTATGGNETGIRVRTSSGRTFTGSRVDGPNSVTYVLTNVSINVCIIIYTPARAMEPVATRLAQNVGNGRGLLEPAYTPLIGVLPARLPAGLVLRELRVITAEELLAAEQELDNWASESSDAEIQQLISQIKFLLPDRITGARYVDSQLRDFSVLVLDYGQVRRVRWIWTLLRWTLGVNAAGTVPMNGGEGIYFNEADERVLLFVNGPYLVILGGPANDSLERLTELGAGVQL